MISTHLGSLLWVWPCALLFSEVDLSVPDSSRAAQTWSSRGKPLLMWNTDVVSKPGQFLQEHAWLLMWNHGSLFWARCKQGRRCWCSWNEKLLLFPAPSECPLVNLEPGRCHGTLPHATVCPAQQVPQLWIAGWVTPSCVHLRGAELVSGAGLDAWERLGTDRCWSLVPVESGSHGLSPGSRDRPGAGGTQVVQKVMV